MSFVKQNEAKAADDGNGMGIDVFEEAEGHQVRSSHWIRIEMMTSGMETQLKLPTVTKKSNPQYAA